MGRFKALPLAAAPCAMVVGPRPIRKAPSSSEAGLAVDACPEQVKKEATGKSKTWCLEEAVRKAIHDNMKGWTDMEINGNRDSEGKTAKDRLRERKELANKFPGEFTCGRKFYTELRAKFKTVSCPEKQLKATGPEILIQEPLYKAMVAYKAHGNRGPMCNFLAVAGKLNQAEIVGILQFALEVKASSSYENLRVAKLLLQFFADKDIKTHYPVEFEHAKKWVDGVLCHLYTKSKQSKIKPSEFIECNRSIVMLVLPEAETSELMKVRCDLAAMEKQLIAVVVSSEIGMLILGWAIEKVLCGVADRHITNSIEELMQDTPIDELKLTAAKRRCVAALQAKDGMDNLPDKQQIILKYRGVPFPIKVVSITEQVECRFACALKSAAAFTGLLPATLCENDLVGKSESEQKVVIEEDVMTAWKAARESSNKMLLATSALDGPSIVKYFAKKEASLRSIGPSFNIEIRFFASMVGESGEQILQDKVKAIMPTQSSGVSEKDALSALRQLQTTGIYTFTGSRSQGSVLSVCSLVLDLLEGRKPSFASNPAPFLADMKVRMGFFCRTKGLDGKTELAGQEAVVYLCTKAFQQDESPSLEDLEMPVKFSWLLDKATASRLEAARKGAVARATASLASVSSQAASSKREAAASSSSAGAAKKKSKGHDTADDAAMAMFKGFA